MLEQIDLDFKKYLKSRKIESKYQAKYLRNAHIIDENSGMITDVFGKLLKERIIFLSGEMDTYLCDLVKANLLYLDSMDDSDIKIYVNSPGGSVYDGLGLLDVMDYIESDISTINTGLAASMAAVLLCSGTKGKRKSLRRARLMIHQPLSFGGWAQQASDMEIEAREVNQLKNELYEIISEKTGQNIDRVHKDGDRDYWMSAQESLKYGMIDEIIIKK